MCHDTVLHVGIGSDECVYRSDATLHRRRSLHGFTLIELLVVVAIIVALLAILLPSMGRAVEATHRAVCASQLKQFAVGTLSYTADNTRQIPSMVAEWGGLYYPDYMRIANTGSGEWCVQTMNPYIKAFTIDPANLAAGSVAGIAMCPSIDADAMMRYIRERNLVALAAKNFIEYQYLYWGRVDQVAAAKPWQLRGRAADELTDNTLSSTRLLISDAINFDWSDRAWRYNHGTRGWAFNEVAYMPWDTDPVPNLTGINRAFGDGSVQWRSRADFPHLNQMNLPSSYTGGAIVSSATNGDAFYY